MKIYTNTFDLATPIPKKIWVAPYSEFCIGIKFVKNGETVKDNCYLTYKNGARLSETSIMVDDYKIYKINSTSPNQTRIYTAYCGNQQIDIIQYTSDSTVFETTEIVGDSNIDYQYITRETPLTIVYKSTMPNVSTIICRGDSETDTSNKFNFDDYIFEYRIIKVNYDGTFTAESDWEIFGNEELLSEMALDWNIGYGMQIRASADNLKSLNEALGGTEDRNYALRIRCYDENGEIIEYSLQGNIMSLFDTKGETDEIQENTLNALFADSGVIDASKLLLPAKTVEQCGYESMFYGCKTLTKAPELPATNIGERAYKSMFDGCENLETPPSVLPAETLANDCYFQMFQGCTNLKTIPDIKATKLAESCCGLMFKDCSSLGDLSKFTLRAEMPPDGDGETSGVRNVKSYQGMFYNTSVTKTPVIMLKKHEFGYESWGVYGTCHLMFANCSEITDAYFPNMNLEQVIKLETAKTFENSNIVKVHYDNNKETYYFND